MPIDEATGLVRSRQLQEYGLALAASPDGAKAHCYLLGEDDVLLFYELNGRVKSVAKVTVSPNFKESRGWTVLPGCRLPAKPGLPSKN